MSTDDADQETERPPDRLVLSYLGEDHYHRGGEEDALRPACSPARLQGIIASRTKVEREGQTPCPACWPAP